MTAPTLDHKQATQEDVTALPCPTFCDGSCEEWRDEDGSTSHWGHIAEVQGDSLDRPKVSLHVTLTQIDSSSEGRSAAEVHLTAGHLGEEFVLPAAHARQLAAALLNAADTADPLPTGVTVIRAEEIRVGDEIETPDGFQRVYMILIDESADHAAAFTGERDDTDTDGWQFTLADMVTVRRAVAR